MSSARLRMMAAMMGTSVDYSRQYLTIEMLEAGTITLNIANDVTVSNCASVSYSVDNGANWVTTPNVASTLVTITTPSLSAGDKVLWKGTASVYSKNDSNTAAKNSYFVLGSTKFKLYGNIASLLYGDNFVGQNTLSTKDYVFTYMFTNNTGLTTAENLVIPFSEMGNKTLCYTFAGCSSMENAPQLPATTLGTACYSNMFKGCTSLLEPPELPATTLAAYCYNCMFYGCSSLNSASSLNATTLANYCYNYMYYGCKNITTAPALNATTLVTGCYYSMFNGCNVLNYVKMMATDISATSCLTNWMYSVASTGTFVKAASMTSLPSGASGIPSGWTVEDES